MIYHKCGQTCSQCQIYESKFPFFIQCVPKLFIFQSNWMKNEHFLNLKCDKTHIVTKLRNLFVKKLKSSNCDKYWILTKVHIWKRKKLKGSFSKNILTCWQPMRCSLGSVLQFSRCFRLEHRSSEQYWYTIVLI